MVEQSIVSPGTCATAHTFETVQAGTPLLQQTPTVLYNCTYVHTYVQAPMMASVGDETTCYVTRAINRCTGVMTCHCGVCILYALHYTRCNFFSAGVCALDFRALTTQEHLRGSKLVPTVCLA